MLIIQSTSKDDLLQQIQSMEDGTREVYINTRPSLDIVTRIVSSAPGVEAIFCPPSLLKQTSTKVFQLLEQNNVKLTHKDVKVGRPRIHDDSRVTKILDLRKAGTPVKEISKQLNVPLRTIYYYLKNNNSQ